MTGWHFSVGGVIYAVRIMRASPGTGYIAYVPFEYGRAYMLDTPSPTEESAVLALAFCLNQTTKVDVFMPGVVPYIRMATIGPRDVDADGRDVP